MTGANLCVHCGRPCPDGYADSDCAQELADVLLVAAGHAEDAEAVIARQARYGAAGRAGSGDGSTPDLTKADDLRNIAREIGTWGQAVTEDTGRRPHWRPLAGPLCPPAGQRCTHWSCEAIRRREAPPQLALELAWLATQTGWLRKHPACDEAFRTLHHACEQLARLVDRPADKELVGMCDCGRVLYAPHGKTAVTCPVPTCKLEWGVTESRDILRRALDGKLVTAAEAARLAQYLDTDRTQQQIRKLINAWSSRALIEAHGEIDDEPTYRFGDIFARLARTPRRAARAA